GMTSKEGALGKPSPFYDVQLRSREGGPVAQGEVGEIVVVPKNGPRQEGVFSGYLYDDAQYEYVWRQGVFHTGDAAYMDEDGYFWFYGRFDDIIKTGGFRVGPYEVENVLMEHPAVVECSVVGVPDQLRGQAIKAFIVAGSGFKPSKALELDIKNSCNNKLAEYKWIRQIEFVDELPKTISGKIRKNELREKGK
ncbi:MAG: AMP-binding protein, partial [Firmicutes bacterium]|nr:AMP-binding protein [Bacillota bacterium]